MSQKKKKQFSYKTDFEGTYLRQTLLAKNMPKVDPQKLETVDCKRVVSYMTSKLYLANVEFLSDRMFGREDIESIVLIYATCFIGMENDRENDMPKKKYYGLMMNFIGQKFYDFLRFMKRKFLYTERRVDSEISYSNDDLGHGNKPSMNSYYTMIEDNRDDEIAINVLELRTYQANAAARLNPCRKTDSKLRLANMNLEKAEKDIETSEKLSKRSRSAQNKKMRELLKADPYKYANKLAFYSTSNTADEDTRRAARKLCKKYGIDYVKLISDHIRDNNLDESNFTF